MKRRKKLKKLGYRQVTTLSVNAFGRKGTFLGETDRRPLPRVGIPRRFWKRDEYYTFFDVRDREHGIGRIQFQRHKKSGLFNLNFQKIGFNSTIVLDDRMLEKIAAFVWAYAHAQSTHGQLPTFDPALGKSFQDGFRKARKRYRLSQSHRKRKA